MPLYKVPLAVFLEADSPSAAISAVTDAADAVITGLPSYVMYHCGPVEELTAEQEERIRRLRMITDSAKDSRPEDFTEVNLEDL